MIEEIGSDFWIAPGQLERLPNLSSPNQFGCRGTDFVWLSTGRSSISFVLKTINSRKVNKNKVALLPSFSCHTVVEPFRKQGFEIFTYDVDENLKISSEALINRIKKHSPSVVLFHRYFGFNTIPDIDKAIKYMRTNEIWSIEDCTQILYSAFQKSDADFLIGSIRKWCGVPDGGFAVCKDGKFGDKPNIYDIRLQKEKYEAAVLKYQYLFEGRGEKDDFLRKFVEAEDVLKNQDRDYKISQISEIMQSNLDVDSLKSRRRNNYTALLNEINCFNTIKPIFNELDDGEVPLYFPLICDDRDTVRTLLINNRIYAPIIWPRPSFYITNSKVIDNIYNHILCIPVDQRYDLGDMSRIIKVLKSSIK